MRRLLPIAIAIAAAGISHATVITVTSTSDAIGDDDDCTLREAIVAANTDAAVDDCAAGDGADVIQVPAGTIQLSVTGASENAAATGDLDVTGELTIDGDGAGSTIIEGFSDASDRLFEIRSGATVTLSGLSLRLSQPALAGGAIHNRADLIIDSCELANNIADGATGGAIYSISSTTLSITNTVFDGNSAGGHGGAINSSGVTTLSGVTFNNNSAGDQGGAVYISPNGTLDMDASVVVGGQATNDGAGLALFGPATISESTIRNNTTAGMGFGGGGIYCGDTLDMTRSLVSQNYSEASGGGILGAGVFCIATLTNVTLYDNAADDHGGGIRLAGGGTVTLNNATIVDNSADDDLSGSGNGGGVDQASGGTVTLRNSVVAGNTDNGAPSDCNGTLTSQGHNLLQSTSGCTMAVQTGDLTGMAPDLAAIADNGGPTETLEPNSGSPLVNAGDPATPGSGGTACELVDQRHYGRPSGIACDIGAVERGASFVTTTTTTSTSTSTSSTSSTSTTTSSTTTTSTTSTSVTTTTSTSVTTTTSTTSTTASTTTSTTVTTTTTSTIGSTSTTTTPSSSSTLPPPSSTSTTVPSPLCAAGAPMSGVKLTLQKVGSPQGDEKMVLVGALQVPAGVAFDPATQGVRLLVEDVSDGTPLLSVFLGSPGCAGDGWKKTTWRGTAPCAQGLRQLKMKDKRRSGGGITFKGQVKSGSMPAPVGPLRIAFVVGPPNGTCVTHRFPPGACTAKGSAYRCK